MASRPAALALILALRFAQLSALSPLPQPALVDARPCTQDERDGKGKSFDVVLLGVTGATGQAAFTYMLHNYFPKVRWAIAGRNYQRMLTFVLRHDDGVRVARSIGILRADLADPASLRNLTKQARVVLSFAGPYERNQGMRLIHAALESCTHYVDMATETKWKRAVHDLFRAAAKVRGVAIVQSAGFEAMAADFLAMSAAQDLADAGYQTPTDVKIMWDVLNHGFGRSQLASEQGALAFHGAVYDPYILAPETPTGLRVDTTVDGHRSQGYDELLQTYVMPYSIGSTNVPVIRRSLHMKYPKDAIHVEEVCSANHPQDLGRFLLETRQPAALPVRPAAGPERDAVRWTGPSQKVQEHGSFRGVAIAYHQDASTSSGAVVPFTRVRMEGIGDPLYVAGPRLAVEMALSLAFDGGNVTAGYTTPSQAVGLAALERRLASIEGGRLLQISHDR